MPRRPGNILVLGQRHRQLTDIEPAMGCNAGPTLNRGLVGRPTSSVRSWRHLLSPWYDVHRRQLLNECWPAPAMLVEGIHVEDIFELKQTKLGPRS